MNGKFLEFLWEYSVSIYTGHSNAVGEGAEATVPYIPGEYSRKNDIVHRPSYIDCTK